MIRLSKLTDYAIVLMAQIAKGDRFFNAPELAAQTDLPLPMASKILKRLAKEGLLDSQRGAKGGYGLQRPADQISVADVITALDGPIAITECADESDECSYEAHCLVRENWQRINRAVRGALEAIPLSDLTGVAGDQQASASGDRQGLDLVSIGR